MRFSHVGRRNGSPLCCHHEMVSESAPFSVDLTSGWEQSIDTLSGLRRWASAGTRLGPPGACHWAAFRKGRVVSVMVIDRFRGEHAFLSNFFPATIYLDEAIYPSVEHAYQATKTLDLRDRLPFQIAGTMTPADAKRAGQLLDLRRDWLRIRVDVMRDLLRRKFARDPLRAQLVSTWPSALIEGNDWNDQFWGTVDGEGQNTLGVLLVEVREEVRQALTRPGSWPCGFWNI